MSGSSALTTTPQVPCVPSACCAGGAGEQRSQAVGAGGRDKQGCRGEDAPATAQMCHMVTIPAGVLPNNVLVAEADRECLILHLARNDIFASRIVLQCRSAPRRRSGTCWCRTSVHSFRSCLGQRADGASFICNTQQSTPPFLQFVAQLFSKVGIGRQVLPTSLQVSASTHPLFR